MSSERPELYWQPFLGELGLRPVDLGDLTPQQMDACYDYIESKVSV